MRNTGNKYYHDLDQEYYLPTFKRFPITFKRGKGSRLWDVEGNEYIDVLAGIAVNSVGHCHPKVVKAIQEQAENLVHVSNFYLSEPQVNLAKKLVELSGLKSVFFTNSGAESVEGAIKLARKYAHKKGRGGKVISMTGSFHGRTLATIATGKKAMQEGFEPIPTGFQQVEFNDLEAVKNAIDDETAAIILEPIQGEGGVNVAEKEFVQGIKALCDKHDIVLIFDEIQCGMGRTGKWFAKEHYGVEPDIMTLAKALGGGVPIGAIISNEKITKAIDFGDHGTTFGGNPLVCAAALASIEVMEEEGLLKAATEKGEHIRKAVEQWNNQSVKQVKGMGLMIGIEFDFETKPLVQELLGRGIIANATAGNILRLVPPLNIPETDLDEVLNAIHESIETVKEHA